MSKNSAQLRQKVKSDHLLRSYEVAEMLGMSVRNVCLLAEIKELPGFKPGRRTWYFWESEILEHLAKRQSDYDQR
jgi:hypothetical protein